MSGFLLSDNLSNYRNQVNSKLFFRQKNVPRKTPESLRSNSRKLIRHSVKLVRNIRISDSIFVFFLWLFCFFTRLYDTKRNHQNC